MPQQKYLAPVEVGNVQEAPEVHFLFYFGVRAFKNNRKGTENIKVSKGDMGSFKFGKSKIIDHLCESTGRLRELLNKTQESDGPITKAYLQDIHVGFGGKAWTVAEDLENFLVKWFNEGMYNRRDQLCGGPDEVGNSM